MSAIVKRSYLCTGQGPGTIRRHFIILGVKVDDIGFSFYILVDDSFGSMHSCDVTDRLKSRAPCRLLSRGHIYALDKVLGPLEDIL